MKSDRVLVLLFVASQIMNVYGMQPDLNAFLPCDLLTYSAKADIFITLPISRQEVRYKAKVISLPSVGSKKELSPVDYLIETEDSLGNLSVCSYFNGNYFAYMNDRLCEYHWERDSLLFEDRVVKGKFMPGIHKSGVASVLVPSVLSENIGNDKNLLSCEGDTLIKGDEATVIKVVNFHNDVVVKKMTIALRKTDRSVLYCESVSNPGTLGEQIIVAKFEESGDACDSIDKELLKKVYPDIFKKQGSDLKR